LIGAAACLQLAACATAEAPAPAQQQADASRPADRDTVTGSRLGNAGDRTVKKIEKSAIRDMKDSTPNPGPRVN
jgi:guanyl-specific ribonuclease Sa